MTTTASQRDHQEFPNVGAVYAARASASQSRDPWVAPMCRPLPTSRKGPFVALADGSLLTVNLEGLSVSHDDGATWAETIPAAHGQDPREPASCSIVEPTPGALVMVFLDRASKKTRFSWNSQTLDRRIRRRRQNVVGPGCHRQTEGRTT